MNSVKTMVGRVASALNALMVVVAITAVLFVAINLLAHYVLKRQAAAAAGASVFDHVLTPASPEGRGVLSRVFADVPESERLSRNADAPNFEMHPGLHYMTQRVHNPYYELGLEGIRYDADWNDKAVRRILGSKRNLVFLLGGSTVLGHGVSGSETISYYLNRMLLPKDAVSLNFGSQAYDFRRSIEKLVYLLREGYRPKAVVFLDGWNELAGLARSNMRWQDKVIFHGFEINRGEVAYTPGAANVEYDKLLLSSLPIVRLINGVKPRHFDIAQVKVARDPFIDGFDFLEANWMFTHWEAYAASNDKLLRNELLMSYQANLSFIRDLSRGFGFDALVVFQPMGLFDKDNPFVPEAARAQFGYAFLNSLRNAVRKEIADGRLWMVDGSNWLGDFKGDRYVDIAHYSPKANAEIAKHIRAALEPSLR